jgi:hypothetical protein
MARAARPRTRTADARTVRLRVLSAAAAGWSALYVASKVHLALTGTLGVTGGPAVTAADHAGYGPGEVAAAQWANAGVGALAVLLVLAPLLPAAARMPRRVLLVPLSALALTTAAGAVVMLGRALLTDAGGAPFGVYCLVWTALVGATAVGYHRMPRGAQPGGVRRSEPSASRRV